MVDRNQLLLNWRQTAIQLKLIKEQEAMLRAEVMKEFFPGATEGTHNVELGNGYKLTAQVSFNYSLARPTKEAPGVDPVITLLNNLSATNELGKVIATRLVRWSPDLSVTEYRKLPLEFKPAVDSILTIKPGAPKVELVEPKVK